MKSSLLFIFFILPLLVIAQSKGKIVWDVNRKLNWNDFTYANKDTVSSYEKAQINPEIQYLIHNKKSTKVEVVVSFLKSESWTLDTLSTDLLAHEQLHFDIAELYGRKIRKETEKLSKLGVQEKSKYIDVINKLLDDYFNRQVIYDKDTAHGTVRTEQSRWEKQIFKELLALEKFSR